MELLLITDDKLLIHAVLNKDSVINGIFYHLSVIKKYGTLIESRISHTLQQVLTGFMRSFSLLFEND